MYRKRTLTARRQGEGAFWRFAIFACATAALWRTQLIPLTAVTMGIAAVSLWDWIVSRVIFYRTMLDKPYQPADDVRMLEAITKMNEYQLTAAFAAMGYEYEAPRELDPPRVDPEITEGVTKSYAISAIDRAARNSGYLEPIGKSSEGTKDRERKRRLYEYLIEQGLATPAVSNRPARVTDAQKARERIHGQ